MSPTYTQPSTYAAFSTGLSEVDVYKRQAQRTAILLVDDYILRNVHQTARQVTGIGRFQRGGLRYAARFDGDVYKRQGDNLPKPGIPEAMNVLLHELRGLALSVKLE